MMPPLITVGSSPAVSSRAPIIEVVVVLPCVPAIAIDHLSRISSAEHLGAAHDRQAARPGGDDLGIVGLDRRRDDDDLGGAEIFGVVADRDRDAEPGEPAGIGAVGEIAALHLVAEIVQHLGDAAHADAADPDEMDGADRLRAAISCGALPLPVRRAPGSSTSAARRSARVVAGEARGPAPRRAAKRRRVGEQLGEAVGQHRRAQRRLRDDPAAAGLGKGAGVGGLVVVGRVRVGHQQRRPAGRGQFGDGRGAGAADHQMRPRQPLGHVGEKALDLGGDAERRGIARRRASRSSGRACWLTRKPRAQLGRQRGQRRRHDLAEDPRALAAAEDQQLDRLPRLRAAVYGCRRRRGSPAAPGCRYGRRAPRSAARSAGGLGKAGGDPLDARGASSRLARPSTAFCSWITVGRPSCAAASIVGTEG